MLPMRGVIAGYPLVNVQATLLFGSYHDVDSNELSFRIAASKCFREASKKSEAYPPRACHESRNQYSRRVHG